MAIVIAGIYHLVLNGNNLSYSIASIMNSA